MHLSVMVNDHYFMEYRYQQQEAMENAKHVIKSVDEEFGGKFGRSYGGLIQPYRMDDADIAILSMGSLSGLSRTAVDELRKEGKKRRFIGQGSQINRNLMLIFVLARI